MNKYIVLCFFLVAALKANAGEYYSGSWNSSSISNDSTFTVVLSLKGNKVTGYYCAVANAGRKIDCDGDGEENIRGALSQDKSTIEVKFYSFFGAVDGKALITRGENETLHWRIVEAPKGQEYYAPRESILTRSRQ